MLQINRHIFNQIKQHALEVPNEECCGLILNNCILKANNVSANKNNSFMIHPKDYLRAEKISEIVGFYHSHSEGSDEFSELDIKHSNHNKLPLVMYHVPTDKFKIHDNFDDNYSKYQKYLGIKFGYNNADCLTLVEEFYTNEFQINLPKITRNQNWFIDTPNILEENIENFGFLKINERPKFGDVFVSPRHLMIYIGRNQILHNMLNSYSHIALYDHKYKKVTKWIARHKLLC